MHLWENGAENVGGGTDEITNQQGEARQTQEEEAGGAGADDGVQNILVTKTDKKKEVTSTNTEDTLWFSYVFEPVR